MELSPGTRLGHFEIVGLVGRGGMGDVFQARDTRLDREVAVKVLSEPVSREPDGLARFTREARMLAALDHPAIAAIHGFEESNGARFLVLEFVPGPTLAERIAHGPMELRAALDIAKQVSLGLGAAHDKGIIHRDLKPANIKVSADGRVKVLDFGIAKMIASGTGPSPILDPSTITIGATEAGMVLGTAAYMSPEQARGLDLDRRTDVWSFGCVLYEMLTGRRAFNGSTATHTIAAVLTSDPDWNALPDATPEGVIGCTTSRTRASRSKRSWPTRTARRRGPGARAGACGVSPGASRRSRCWRWRAWRCSACRARRTRSCAVSI
jgi:serine/threonine protein kinase